MSSKTRNAAVAGAVTLFAIGMGSVPFWYTRSMQQKGKSLFGGEGALPGQTVIRGAFVNSGSRDVGPDPDWDPKTNSWKGRRNPVRKGNTDENAGEARPSQ